MNEYCHPSIPKSISKLERTNLCTFLDVSATDHTEKMLYRFLQLGVLIAVAITICGLLVEENLFPSEVSLTLASTHLK